MPRSKYLNGEDNWTTQTASESIKSRPDKLDYLTLKRSRYTVTSLEMPLSVAEIKATEIN